MPIRLVPGITKLEDVILHVLCPGHNHWHLPWRYCKDLGFYFSSFFNVLFRCYLGDTSLLSEATWRISSQCSHESN